VTKAYLPGLRDRRLIFKMFNQDIHEDVKEISRQAAILILFANQNKSSALKRIFKLELAMSEVYVLAISLPHHNFAFSIQLAGRQE